MGYNQDMNLILFDIDNTLLDTPRYAGVAFERMRQILDMSEIDFAQRKDAFYQTLEESTDFSPEQFVAFLKVEEEVQRVDLLQCWYDEALLNHCVFVDFTRNLERFQTKCVLGIFSQGNAEFQIKKLQLMGIYGIFEQKYLFIKERKSSPESLQELQALIEPSEDFSFSQILVVDDKVEYLKALHQISQVSPVLIQRETPDKVSAENEIPGLRIVSSLSDL